MGTTYLAPRANMGGSRHLQIGQLAVEVGLNPRTIRYYEAIGLLPVPQRTDAGYRLYSDADVERLRFIGKAKLVGLSLDEIGEIFKRRSDGELPCARVLDMLDQKVAAVDAQLRALEVFRQELVALRQQAIPHGCADTIICGIIEAHEPTQTIVASAILAKAGRDMKRRSS